MLTADLVRNETEPGTYWDKGAVPGFGLRISKGGAKSFFLNYWLGGRECRFTIGGFPRWSVGAAREEAKELRKRIDRGENPAGEKRERRDAPTIQDLIDRFVRENLSKRSIANKPLRVKDEMRKLMEIGEKLGRHTKVVDVHPGDIIDMHRRITESGRPARANRIKDLCHTMFELTLLPLPGENTPWRDRALGNPCKGVKKNPEQGRERFFSQSELSAISDALNKYPGVAADAVRLIMFTGARPFETMQATWQEFDAEPGVWTKPSHHTKQRRVHRLPLNPPALALVDRMRQERKNTRWVFPGQKGKHLVTLEHIWDFVRKETNLGKSARLYDLRHTFASVGAGGGLSLPIIGKLLGHTQPRTTARYAHFGDDPLREATKKIGSVIAGNGNANNVVKIGG